MHGLGFTSTNSKFHPSELIRFWRCQNVEFYWLASGCIGQLWMQFTSAMYGRKGDWLVPTTSFSAFHRCLCSFSTACFTRHCQNFFMLFYRFFFVHSTAETRSSRNGRQYGQKSCCTAFVIVATLSILLLSAHAWFLNSCSWKPPEAVLHDRAFLRLHSTVSQWRCGSQRSSCFL